MTIQNQPLQRNKDSLIQLQQKNIHYRSEISRLNLIIEEYEKQLQTRNADVERMKEHLQLIESEKNDALNKSVIKPIAFFNYSVIFPDPKSDEEVIVLGNFIIRNIGNTILSYPVICLRISPPSVAGKLGGKIRYRSLANDSNDLQIIEHTASEEWVFVNNEWQENVLKKGEYWLKPTHQTIIPPNEEISFSNFELSLNVKETNSINLNGFVYFEQLTEGIAALNNIQLN